MLWRFESHRLAAYALPLRRVADWTTPMTLGKHGLGRFLNPAGKSFGATVRLWSATLGMARSAATVPPRSQRC